MIDLFYHFKGWGAIFIFTLFLIKNIRESFDNKTKIVYLRRRILTKKEGKMEALVNFYREVNSHSGDTYLLKKDLKIVVDRGVSNPNLSTTKLMAEYIDQNPEIIKEKVIADCRCGCGVLGIQAALSGAKQVFFTDSSPLALSNTEKNIKKIGLCKSMEVIESDLLEDIPEPVDVIFFSHLLLPGNPKRFNWLEGNLFNDGQILDRFFFQALTFLKPDGKIFIPFNRAIGDVNGPAFFSTKRKLQARIAYNKKMSEGEIMIYEFKHF